MTGFFLAPPPVFYAVPGVYAGVPFVLFLLPVPSTFILNSPI